MGGILHTGGKMLALLPCVFRPVAPLLCWQVYTLALLHSPKLHSSTHPLSHSPTLPLSESSQSHTLAFMHSRTHTLSHSPTNTLSHSPIFCAKIRRICYAQAVLCIWIPATAETAINNESITPGFDHEVQGDDKPHPPHPQCRARPIPQWLRTYTSWGLPARCETRCSSWHQCRFAQIPFVRRPSATPKRACRHTKKLITNHCEGSSGKGSFINIWPYRIITV